MGRLSAYAKNRILKLRFKKNKRIIHIVEILKRDDNIKVSRQAVSTFLKKYLETNSIYDKPRTGRKRKLTQEEIQLIGQVTRLNRDITARAIKEYLNLNVSTYTILRATKLFEWNKINPNSNDSKKAAALERQLNGESDLERRRSTSTNSAKKNSKSAKRNSKPSDNDDGGGGEGIYDDGGIEEVENVNEKKIIRIHTQLDDQNQEHFASNQEESYEDPNNTEDVVSQLDEIERIQNKLLTTAENSTVTLDQEMNNDEMINFKKSGLAKKLPKTSTNVPEIEKIDLQLLEHKELLILKNLSCSPMSFATKILFKIFKIEELHGHNVSGKTLNKNIKTKLPLDPIRIGYIKYLVESYYDEKECREMLSGAVTHKQDLWKSCHTAINKSILISERKAAMNITQTTSPNDSINLNATNLTSENETKPITRKSRKSKYDVEISTSSGDNDDELEGVQASKNKKTIKNSANTTSVLARNRASHASKNKPQSGSSLKQIPQKRLRRFKSDESSSSCSSIDFGDNKFFSEEFDTAEEGSENENSDEEIEKALKAASKSTAKTRPRNSKRTKKRPNKIFNEDTLNYETDSDENDDEEDCQNEIELIQNIEKRLLNNNNNQTTVTTATSTAKTKTPSQKPTHLQTPKEEKVSSSEASAAANIAAAMKKRIVVIGPENVHSESEIEHATSVTITTNPSVSVIPPASQAKQPRSSITVNKKLNHSSSNTKAENNSFTSTTTPATVNSNSTEPNSDASKNKQQTTRSNPSRSSTTQVKPKTSTTTNAVKFEPDSSPLHKKSVEIITKKTPQSTSIKSTSINQTPPPSSNEQRITRSSAKK